MSRLGADEAAGVDQVPAEAEAAAAVGDVLAGLPPLLSVERAAAVLGISRASAYRYAAAGDLPARRLGGRVYVLTAGLRDLLAVAR